MTPEWMIAAQCAVSSGGVPVATGACIAGRLTLREIGKCFSTGKIGSDGCFGKNNTIVVAFRDAAHDITEGPGRNNEISKAFRAVGVSDVSLRTPFGGEHSAVNEFLRKPLGGDHAAIPEFLNKPLGGDHAAIPEFLNKPLGGDHSVVNDVLHGHLF
jgi:hypothetical protein